MLPRLRGQSSDRGLLRRAKAGEKAGKGKKISNHAKGCQIRVPGALPRKKVGTLDAEGSLIVSFSHFEV